MRKDSPDDICWVTGKLPPEDCPPTNPPPPPPGLWLGTGAIFRAAIFVVPIFEFRFS